MRWIDVMEFSRAAPKSYSRSIEPRLVRIEYGSRIASSRSDRPLSGSLVAVSEST